MPNQYQSPHSLVLHDYFESAEGGGRLSSLLTTGVGADLGYGFARPGHPFVQGAALNPHERDLRCYSRLPLWRQWKLARAFASRTAFIRDYRCVVYSGFYTPLAVVQRPQGRNLLYCHTPPRFIYDQRDFYLQQLAPPLRPLLLAFMHYLQPRYEAAVQQMDGVIANSEHIRQRIKQHLGVTAQVVYPPCEVERFRWLEAGSYYLSLARLDPLKRVDRIIRAFLEMPDQQLVVASGGSAANALRRLAGDAPNIRFTGWLSDAALRDLLGRAIASIYIPTAEDFGMSPVESMAAGKPVIGVAEGGLLETIVPEETGLLLPPDPTPEQLRAAVRWLDGARAKQMRATCESRARQFRLAVFLEKMQALMNA